MKTRIAFFSLFSIACISLNAQQRVEPSGGMQRFQDSLYAANDSLKLLIPAGLPVVAVYDFTLRKNKIAEINLTAQRNLKSGADKILKRALLASDWKSVKSKKSEVVYRVVFWFGRLHYSDSSALADTARKTPVVIESDDDDQPMLKDQMATYPGGEQPFISLIAQSFIYPSRCRDKGISGYVKLKFKVNYDGSITNFVVLEETATCPEFTKEAIRVIKLSEPWLPAIKDGVPIPALRVLPIRLDMK